jgi:formylglycine-generating enzyme required for sulfatase activity
METLVSLAKRKDMRARVYGTLLSLWLLLLAFLLDAQAPVQKPGRHALIIGNARYSSLPPLLVVEQERKLMEAALADAEFDVTIIEDAPLPALFAAIQKFLEAVQPGDICLFYYSGYAVQAGNDNYILPVDFDGKGELPIDGRAYAVARLADELEVRRAGLKVFVLEASRQLAPIPHVTGPGLTNPGTDVKQMYFASAAQPNQIVEAVPDGQPDWFSRVVAEDMQKRPGIPLDELFQLAYRTVAKWTNQHQLPFLQSNFAGDFSFHAPESKLQIVQNHRDRTDYVLLSGGPFLMGCVPTDPRCKENEKPQHPVTLSSFWMATTEVDVTAYQRYVEARKSEHTKAKMPPAPLFNKGWQQSNHPIVNVSWDEAQSYCSWVGGRLPTEAEWEYAARGNQENHIYPLNDENSRDKANFYGKKGNDIFEFTAPLKSFDPNTFQLYDMAGNVWEWVSDWYSPTSYANSPAADPKGPESGKEHVARGGSWDSDPKEHLRISFRKSSGKGTNNLGFRCVLEDTPQIRRLLQLPD